MTAKFILSAFLLAAVGSVSLADMSRPPPAQACAAFDLHVLTRLEDHGRAPTSTGHVIATAVADLVDARSACFRGHYDLALDRYSRIDLLRAPAPSADLADDR